MGAKKITIAKVWRASFILVLALTPLVYFVGKAETRLIGYRLIQNTQCYGQNKQTGIYEIKPNCEQLISIDDRLVRMTTDSFGFRSAGPLNGKKRVLVLGGSLQAGFGLSDDQLRPINALAQKSSQNFPDFDWVNASVQGYTTTHLAVRFRELIDLFHPDLVVLDSLHGQHLLKDAALFERIEFGEAGVPLRLSAPDESRSPFLKWGLGLGLRRSILNDLLAYYDVVRTARRIHDIESRAERQTAWIQPTVTLLKYMKQIANEHGTRFVVLLDGSDLNQNISVNEDVTKKIASLAIFLVPRNQILPAREVADALSANGIDHVVLPEEFWKTIANQPGFLLEDGYHLNEKGSDLYGRYAFEVLRPELGKVTEAGTAR